MKKIFAFAIALVAMATSMTSCNNDDADFVMQPAPAPIEAVHTQPAKETKTTLDILLPVTDVQLEMMSIELHYTICGKTYTVTTDQMTEAETRMPDVETRGVGKTKMLTYHIPGSFYKEELEDATVEYTIQRNEEGIAKYQDQFVNLYAGFQCKITSDYSMSRETGSYTRLFGVELSDEGNINQLYSNIQSMGKSIKIIRNK